MFVRPLSFTGNNSRAAGRFFVKYYAGEIEQNLLANFSLG
jgi:hypothetical protein